MRAGDKIGENFLLVKISTCTVNVYSLSCTLMNTVSDVNECVEDTDDCAQVCIDIDLGYTCSCQSGYRLASDGRGCDGKARNLMHNVISSIYAYMRILP